MDAVTEQAVTRFCPTLHSGPLHVGHMVNLLANVLYARRHGGRWVFSCENLNLFYPRCASYVAENLDVAGAFALLDQGANIVPIVTPAGQPLQSHYMRALLSYAGVLERGQEPVAAFFEDESPCSLPCRDDIEFLTALSDVGSGVNTIVRGRDWGASDNVGNRLKIVKHSALLEQFRRSRGKTGAVRHFYHPLMLAKGSDEKLSKSMIAWRKENTANKAVLQDIVWGLRHHIGEDRILPLSVVVYVMSLFQGGEFSSLADVTTFYERFDIEKLAQMDDFVYDPDDLYRIDPCVKSWVVELAGIDKNMDILAVHEKSKEVLRSILYGCPEPPIRVIH